MQKHWYIIYTKPLCERKVSGLLTKKKIKNFCPVYCKQISRYNRMKLVYEPLFSCYVFAYIAETEIKLIKQLHDVINLVYWKGHPAIVQNEEIEEIREFVTNHQNIRLERSSINVNPQASIIEPPSYSKDGNVVMIKNTFIKVDLPSLGFTMLAEVDGNEVLSTRIEVPRKEEKQLKRDVFTSM